MKAFVEDFKKQIREDFGGGRAEAGADVRRSEGRHGRRDEPVADRRKGKRRRLR